MQQTGPEGVQKQAKLDGEGYLVGSMKMTEIWTSQFYKWYKRDKQYE